MRVCVVGTGYIGLPTALMLASHGVDVEAVGHHQSTVDKLRSGNVTFEEKGLPELFEQAREINSAMPAYVLDRIESVMEEKGLRDYSRIGLYGLTYKENVDDTRESPTLQLLEVMERRGLPAPIVYDPMVSVKKAERQCFDYQEFLDGADIIVILVGHSHIKENLDTLKGRTVLDTRSIIQDGSAYTL